MSQDKISTISAMRLLGWSHPVNVEARRGALIGMMAALLSFAGYQTMDMTLHLASFMVALTWHLTRGPAYEMGKLIGRLDAEAEAMTKAEKK